jgi:hypothetical protein
MIAESQIREKLGRFLSKEISLDQFEDWLVQRSWNMHKSSDEAAQKLASAIELRLAEYSSDHLDETSLYEELRPFVTSYTMQLAFGAPNAFTTEEPPNNVTVEGSLQVAFPVLRTVQTAVDLFVDTEHASAHG